MERPGEYLKRERTLRDVSLESVHEATCVSMKLLVALEADNHEILPHPTFVKGFIQSYAKYLGLDETEAILRYELFLREESQEDSSGTPKGWQTEDSGSVALKSSRTIQILVAAGVVVMVILYLSSFRGGGDKVPAVSKTRLPELATPEVEVAEAKPKVRAEVRAKAKPKVKPEVRAEAKPEVKPEVKVEAQPEVEAEAQPEVDGVVAGLAPPSAAPLTAAVASATKKHTLEVRAKEDAWVEVAIDGLEPFDVLLKAGERVVWKAVEEFFLVLGNAGGVELKLDGKKVRVRGESGRVVTLKLPDKDTSTANEPNFDWADNF